MFQGVFDVLLAQKIVSNLLFEKCSRFHISKIIWDIIPHPGTFVRKALSSHLWPRPWYLPIIHSSFFIFLKPKIVFLKV